MSNKFTFKQHKKETGLRAVSYPYSSIDIKIQGKQVGIINAPNWHTKDNLWSISLAVQTQKDWEWLRLNKKCVDKEEAKTWLNENFKSITERYTLHTFESDE